MRLTVVLEARYGRTPNGAIWSHSGMAYSFWRRYLEVFEEVTVVARVRPTATLQGEAERVDGFGVGVTGLPDYQGPLSFVLKSIGFLRAIKRATPTSGAVILRVGSHAANLMEPVLSRMGKPYGLELVGDPDLVFAPGVVDHPLRPYFRWELTRRLRRQCANACGVAYVTKKALQDKYPPRPREMGGFSTNYSSIELSREYFEERTRPRAASPPARLVTVGSLEQRYKGVDTVIESIGICRARGVATRLSVVGDGKRRLELMQLVEERELVGEVTFLGQLPGCRAVMDVIDDHDLFVLASRTEGLPRAMIEAMARGLPCIGTAVGGIPELLEPDELVPPDDATRLAAKIQEVLCNPARMEEMGRRNREKAREYAEEVLAKRRRKFYEHIRNCTREWEDLGENAK